MSRSTSGPLKDLPTLSSSSTRGVAAADADHNPHSYFNNSDDDEDDEDEDAGVIASRMSALDKQIADMEKDDSTLAHLKRNIQQGDNDASEVISESQSVASEDLDVLEFSNGGGGNQSDSDEGF